MLSDRKLRTYRVAHEAKAFYTIFRGHGDDCAVIRFHIPVLRRPYVEELPQVAPALCDVGSRADMREEATDTVHSSFDEAKRQHVPVPVSAGDTEKLASDQARHTLPPTHITPTPPYL